MVKRKTCGRCHQTSKDCLGEGIARNCEAKNGTKVMLSDHMRANWEKIGFNQGEFKLNGDIEDVENIENISSPKRVSMTEKTR